MVHNKKPVSGWNPTRGPKKLDQNYNLFEEQKRLGLELSVTRDTMILDYQHYAKIINKNSSNKVLKL